MRWAEYKQHRPQIHRRIPTTANRRLKVVTSITEFTANRRSFQTPLISSSLTDSFVFYTTQIAITFSFTLYKTRSVSQTIHWTPKFARFQAHTTSLLLESSTFSPLDLVVVLESIFALGAFPFGVVECGGTLFGNAFSKYFNISVKAFWSVANAADKAGVPNPCDMRLKCVKHRCMAGSKIGCGREFPIGVLSWHKTSWSSFVICLWNKKYMQKYNSPTGKNLILFSNSRQVMCDLFKGSILSTPQTV